MKLAFRSQFRASFVCAGVCAALWLGLPGAAAADSDAEGLRWNPSFTRFTVTQYALTLTGAGSIVASGEMLESTNGANWRSNILFDGEARGLFAASSDEGRRFASSVSDYMALGLVLYPFAVDSLLVAAGIHHNYDVALQLALIGIQGMVFANLATNLSKKLVGRARPDYGECKQGNELACSTENESFISGHTSAAFTGAGLICATHQNLRLYGSGAAGAVACGVSLGAATAVGTLRMVADRHHLSDVVAGAAVGLAVGYLLPNLINYDFGHSGRSRGKLMPLAGNGTFGLEYVRSL